MQKQKDVVFKSFYKWHRRAVVFISICLFAAISVMIILDWVSRKSSEFIIRNEAARILNKKPNELVDSDFAKIVTIDIPAKNLTNISFLGKFINLQELRFHSSDFNGTGRPRFNPLLLWLDKINLIKLNNLKNSGSGNDKIAIKNIKPLSNLANLKELHLNWTKVNNIKPLKKLLNLQVLNIAGTEVRNLDPIKDLKNLQDLYAGPNVQSLEPIRYLKNLKTLHVYGSQISDIEPISELTNLERLAINETQVVNLDSIKKLKNLKFLELNDTQINSLEPVQGLTSLEELSFIRTRVFSLEPLHELKNLKSLSFGNNQINYLNPLQNYENSGYLHLIQKDINDLEPISDLSNLESLSISRTGISNVEPLKKLKKLNSIMLFDCPKITEQQINELKVTFPNIQIYKPGMVNFTVFDST